MFPSMPTILEESEKGLAKIDHYEVNKFESVMSGFKRGMYCREGKYARLIVNGQLMMSDTQMERYSNSHFLRCAHGDVLVAGLGLGMILHPALAKPEVKRITVIEKYQDVIDLVSPSLQSEKLEIVCADIMSWTPDKGRKFSIIYFDIWPTICEDNLDEITKLHQRFKSRVDRTDGDCWMGSWMHDELKRERRRSQRDSWRF